MSYLTIRAFRYGRTDPNYRKLLSQLRSGYSRLLNSYLHRIDDNIEDKCPLCNQTPHDTVDLFNCPNNPTHLTVLSLWTQPVLAKKFFKTRRGCNLNRTIFKQFNWRDFLLEANQSINRKLLKTTSF